jgi:hypothetical protein
MNRVFVTLTVALGAVFAPVGWLFLRMPPMCVRT